MRVGVIFASRTPYPACPARPPTQHMSFPPSTSSPLFPLLSSLLLPPHPLCANLLRHHTLCCVISISSLSGRWACLCPLCSISDVFISVNVHVQGHTQTHRRAFFFFPRSAAKLSSKPCLISSSSVAQAPHASAGRGYEAWGRGRVDTWCPLSLRTVNLPGEAEGEGKKNLLAGSCLSSKLFIFVEKLRVCEDLCKQASTRFWNKTKQTKGKTAKRTNCQKNKKKKQVSLLEVGFRPA